MIIKKGNKLCLKSVNVKTHNITEESSFLFDLLNSFEESRIYSSFTPDIGNDICGYLNTIGGFVLIGYNEREYNNNFKDNLNKDLNSLYEQFNYNPSEWITVKITKYFGFKYIILRILAPNNGCIFTYKGYEYYNDQNEFEWTEDNVVIKSNLRNALGLPIFSEYAPSDRDKKEVFEDTKKRNNISYYRIGEWPKNRSTFYKYISLDIALSIFRKDPDNKSESGQRNPPQTMRFVEPSKWEDQYEHRFYTADYSKVNKNSDYVPKLYATCFTPRKESEPAWQIYTRGKDGLGKRCVQFCINQVALRNQLMENLKDCTIVEGSVHYLSTYEIETYHLSTDKDGNLNNEYLKRFSNFTLENYISLLLLKRTAFEHEQEVRIFIIYNEDKNGRKSKTKEKAKHKDISLDWLSFLEGIKVDPKCSDIEIKLLQDEINRLIDDTVKQEDREAMKKKLTITTYDVNEDSKGDQQLKIGETYKHYEERLLADSKKP